MAAANHGRARGVTLLELLVVLMILSIVLTAAVKTWDVTLERGRAQTTARKLNQLVGVIVGDPDFIVAGQRADFGFVGDVGRVPYSLRELVVRPPGDSVWRGPYIRSTFNQSADGYRIDGWGDTIIYGYEAYGNNTDSLWVRSYGGRGFADRTRWQTYNFQFNYLALTNNEVGGQIVDVRGDPVPLEGDTKEHLRMRLYYPRNGAMYVDEKNTDDVVPDFRYLGIPQGTHRLEALYIFYGPPRDSVMTVQDVPVYPGIGARDVTMRLPLDWDQMP